MQTCKEGDESRFSTLVRSYRQIYAGAILIIKTNIFSILGEKEFIVGTVEEKHFLRNWKCVICWIINQFLIQTSTLDSAVDSGLKILNLEPTDSKFEIRFGSTFSGSYAFKLLIETISCINNQLPIPTFNLDSTIKVLQSIKVRKTSKVNPSNYFLIGWI